MSRQTYDHPGFNEGLWPPPEDGFCEDCHDQPDDYGWLTVCSFDGWVCDDCASTRMLEE